MTEDEFRSMLIAQNQELIALNRQALDIVQTVLHQNTRDGAPALEYESGDPYSSMEQNEEDDEENLFPGETIDLDDLVLEAEREIDREYDREQ